MQTFSRELTVTFGDCDPAGIVYYPNIFRWVDGTFHAYLRGFGGHDAVAWALGSAGIGLISSEAAFRRPMRDGDRLHLSLAFSEWGTKSFRLCYSGRVGETETFTAEERRGVFVLTGNGLARGPVAPLRALLEADQTPR